MKKTLFLAVTLIGVTAALAEPDNSKANWSVDCAMCHGHQGRGDTPAGRMLGAPDYRDPKTQASFTDEQAFNAIKNGLRKDGRRKMKAFGGDLTDQDIRELVQYIRSFKRGN
jgi:cytochrome c553